MIDDGQLWHRVCQKDAAAFHELYRCYGGHLRSFLKHLLQDSQAAQDVAQETFASLWQRPNGFDAARGTLRSYLFGVGRKRAADWRRKQKPETDCPPEKLEPCKAETQSVIGDAFARLSEEQRGLLWLREVEGQSYAEISTILEIPVGTVRSRLFAAREALRNIWHAGHNTREKV